MRAGVADRRGRRGAERARTASRWLGRLRYAAAASLSAAATPPLAAGLAARYVPPDALWWPQLAALALPALALASAPSAAWLWRTASREGRSARAGRLAGRSLASLQGALVLVACAQYAADRVPVGSDAPGSSDATGAREGGDPGRGGARELTVMSLNVGQGPARPRPLADALDALRPDVVALQEATLRVVAVADAPGGVALAAPPSVSALASHPAYRLAVPDVDAGALPSEGTTVQNPVFVRADRVGRAASPASGGEPVSLGPGESPGTYTRAVVEWDGRPVAVYSVHLRSFGRWRQARRPPGFAGLARHARRALAGMRRDLVLRAAEADRLRAVLDAEPLPYLVAGDLNSTPAQWAYRRVAERSDDALALGGGPYPRTYPARSPLVRIDAVLASTAFEVVAASVGPPGLSDHRPVVATVRLLDAVFSAPASPETAGSP